MSLQNKYLNTSWNITEKTRPNAKICLRGNTIIHHPEESSRDNIQKNALEVINFYELRPIKTK